MKRWGLYFFVVALVLFALGIGGLNILYRWRVKPLLTSALATQEKYHAQYEDDIAFLERTAARLGYNDRSHEHDAGEILNDRLLWLPAIKNSKFKDGKSIVDQETRIDVLRLRNDWMMQVAKGRKPKVDLSIFEDLSQYDHWDIEKNSPIAELIERRVFVPPTRLPIPDTGDLITAAKLRLIDGGLTKEYLKALQDVRQLAQLLMTTENMQLVLSGLAILDHERTAFRYYVDELGWKGSTWMPVDRNVTRRAHRAIIATRGYLRLWTKPERLQAYFLTDSTPVGYCAAVNEAFPFDYALRRVLEPHLPFEVDTRAEYARLDRVLLKARSKCRLKYLVRLNETKMFNVPVPGPLFFGELPYSRKIFGMRLSAADLAGFESYGKQAGGEGL